jgi:hypothetical protein
LGTESAHAAVVTATVYIVISMTTTASSTTCWTVHFVCSWMIKIASSFVKRLYSEIHFELIEILGIRFVSIRCECSSHLF